MARRKVEARATALNCAREFETGDLIADFFTGDCMTTTETPDAGLAEKAAELLKGLDKTHVGAAMSKFTLFTTLARPSQHR